MKTLIQISLAAAFVLVGRQIHAQSNFVNSLKLTTATAPKPWKRSPFLQLEKSKALEEIYGSTIENLKSPDRVQKVGGGDLGGGNILICQTGLYTYSARLLDLYEAEVKGLNIDFGSGSTFIEKLDYVFDRLDKVSPGRAGVYRAMARNLLNQDTQWVQNTFMPLIDDVKAVKIPKGCLLVLAAYQRPINQERLPNVKTYFIDRDMFALLSEESKAALILHEVLYREARYGGAMNSDFVRSLVGVLVSDKILEYDAVKLNTFYKKNVSMAICFESRILPVLVPYSIDPMEDHLRNNGPCKYTRNLSATVSRAFSENNYQMQFEGVIWGFVDSVEYNQVTFNGKLLQTFNRFSLSAEAAQITGVKREMTYTSNMDIGETMKVSVENNDRNSDYFKTYSKVDYFGKISLSFAGEVTLDADNDTCDYTNPKDCVRRFISFRTDSIGSGWEGPGFTIVDRGMVAFKYDPVEKNFVRDPKFKGTQPRGGFKLNVNRSDFKYQCREVVRHTNTEGTHPVDVSDCAASADMHVCDQFAKSRGEAIVKSVHIEDDSLVGFSFEVGSTRESGYDIFNKFCVFTKK